MSEFKKLKKELEIKKIMTIKFKSGYESVEFSNFLNSCKIWHTKQTLRCRPVCERIFAIIEY